MALPQLTTPVHRGASGWRLGDARRAALRPHADVEALAPSSFLAASATPWLRIEVEGGVPAGRWVRLRYRAGLLGDPTRPVLRLERASGEADHALLPGPVCGAASWTGPLPADCTGLLLNPVASLGPFVFALDSVAVMSRPRLVLEALGRKPGLTLTTIGQRLRGRRVRARHLMESILASTPFERYGAWLADREARPPLDEVAGGEEARIGLLVAAERGQAAALARTLTSLERQLPGRWRAVVVSARDLDEASTELIAAAGRRGMAIGLAPAGPDRWSALAGAVDHVAVLRAGDALAPTAIQALAAVLLRHPKADLLSCDEDRVDPAGVRSRPCLRPSWSPRLHEACGYLDGLTLVRAEVLAGLGATGSQDLAREVVEAALARPDPAVHHLRRILLHRPLDNGRETVPPLARASVRAEAAHERHPQVSAVIPTRDRLNLLRPCIEGLLGGTAYPALDVVIVDNGSSAPETHAFYRSLEGNGRVTILDRPGPFNFSALTNAGVAASRGELTMLLNNDMEVVAPGWLDLLVAEAMPADVGAVGPKLLYPNGRVQHAGVVIGLGGAAGHIYRNRPNEGLGWMGCLQAPHEVSAVTGACLLLRRERYEAVGGLDDVDLPVSFNDIDLCLKLRDKGWRNLLVPDAVLLHHESASRGRDDRGEKQRRAERESRRFSERWLHVMRDDPYFHPGLSLLRLDPHLG